MTTETPPGQAPVTDTIDLITYAGEISTLGYEAICEELKRQASPRALLILATPGGDPHAGFRIARALQHVYDGFDALVPRYCKSAGTLILTGARTLYLDDMSELGPLDVQVKKTDEVMGRSSGLDYFQAVNNLQGQAMNAFRSHLHELTQNVGLSTKIASEISTRLALGMLDPISAQIDPIRLAEMQRATEIAFAYGERLNQHSNNCRAGGIARLVTHYPSHSFVIDRKEARTIFTDVRKPEGVLLQCSNALRSEMMAHVNATSPKVRLITIPYSQPAEVNAEGDANVQAAAPDTEAGPGSVPAGQPEVDGHTEGVASILAFPAAAKDA